MQLEMRRSTRTFVIAQRTSALYRKKLSGSVSNPIMVTILLNYLVLVSDIVHINMAYKCGLKYRYRNHQNEFRCVLAKFKMIETILPWTFRWMELLESRLRCINWKLKNFTGLNCMCMIHVENIDVGFHLCSSLWIKSWRDVYALKLLHICLASLCLSLNYLRSWSIYPNFIICVQDIAEHLTTVHLKRCERGKRCLYEGSTPLASFPNLWVILCF